MIFVQGVVKFDLVHSMKGCRGVEVEPHSFLSFATSRTGRFTSGGRFFGTHLLKGWMGPREFEEKIPYLCQVTESWFLGTFANLRKVTTSFVMYLRLSVRPHGTTRLALDGFSWNLVFVNFSEICRENSSFIKIGQEKWVLHIKTNIHFYHI